MCASSSPKKEGLVYKRRKLQQNTVAILSEEITRENSYCPSSITFEEVHLTLRTDDVNKTTVISAEGTGRDTLAVNGAMISEGHQPQEPTCAARIKINDRTLEAIPINTCSDKWDETHPTASMSALCRPKFEHNSAMQDACSSSKSITRHCTTSKRTEADDVGECSSTENMFMKPSLEYTSSRDFCIFVLKSLGLLNGSCAYVGSASSENLDDNDKSTLPCKKCGLQENPRKMLICDQCDEAIHVSCNNSKVKKLPVEEWYCQPCMRKRPKPFLTSNSGKTSRQLNPISSMFVDNQPYVSGARIRKDYQVEVPEWCGPTSIDNDYFNETSALDATEDAIATGFPSNMPLTHHSVGNWVQCQEVNYNGADDEGTICGKWRRAPLSVVQTDDWDCSCALPWDPIHADCAVPQELDTDVVLKHLKYIHTIGVRMANSTWKPEQTNK